MRTGGESEASDVEVLAGQVRSGKAEHELTCESTRTLLVSSCWPKTRLALAQVSSAKYSLLTSDEHKYLP